MQANRNKLNKSVGRLRGDKKLDDAARLAVAASAAAAIESGDLDGALALLTGATPPNGGAPAADALDRLSGALGELANRVEAINGEVKTVESQLDDEMLWIPNLPHESVPVFPSEEDNIAWEPEGEFRAFDFEPKPHWELGPALNLIDFERGVKIAGSRGYVLRGDGARLQRSLIAFLLDMARAKGFTEFYLPYMVRDDSLIGAGQFPKFRDVVYHDADADVYMLPTAEVALTSMHRDEIFDAAQLPIYYVAHTPCFRREKLSAGRDVRGIKRVHQFEKVEMYKFTTPETSYAELEALVEASSAVCRALKIPFRRLEIVTGDLGFSASKKYDLEMWAPGSQEWLEVSSCSNTEAFQARRANLKYRAEGQKKPQFVHTLNGSALGVPRTLIAILENYQQADGSVAVPEVLQPYLGGQTTIRAPEA
ncbi:MAG: serine--tRNA ligase [Chloroflexi bacterium]|nr:serine--tRNA ligase [Chloroflexota bacterium]